MPFRSPSVAFDAAKALLKLDDAKAVPPFAGNATFVRVPGGLIVKNTVALCTTAFWVPVMVSVNVPVVALVDVETVSVDVAVGLTGVGSEQVVPEGQPVNARSTFPPNPFSAVTVTVEVAAPPGTSVNDDGFVEIAKSGLVDKFA